MLNRSRFDPKLFGQRLLLEFQTIVYLLFVVFPAILLSPLSVVPLFFLKQGVTLIAKLFRPDLGHPLPISNSLFAFEDIVRRPKLNIIVCLVLDGPVSNCVDQLRSIFVQRVLNKPKRKTAQVSGQPEGQGQVGPLYYPELRQFSSSFLGYFFWKNEPHFDINQHIRQCDFVGKDGFKIPEVCHVGDLQELATRLMSEPWKPEFSPWEGLVINNYVHGNHGDDDPELRSKGQVDQKREMQTALVLRFHHVLGDGKAWTTLCLRDLFQFKDPIYPKEVESKSFRKFNLVRLLMTPIKMPYDFAKNMTESADSSDPEVNPWHTGQKRKKEYFTVLSSPIPVQQVKDLKNKFGVSYAAILVTAISGAIRRVMKKAGQNAPETMAVGMILPLSGAHPEGLEIHATAMPLKWPIGTEDPLLRLKKIHREIGAKKTSLFPLAGYYAVLLAGVLPNFVRRLWYNKIPCSMVATLFPGPMTSPNVMGRQVLDAATCVGLGPGQLGVTITSFVIGGKQRVWITIDQSLFPSKDAFQELGEMITDELQTLQRLSSESFKCKLGETLV